MNQSSAFGFQRLKTFGKRVLTRIRISSARPLRIVVGSSGIAPGGWLATDRDVLDVTNASDWHRLFAPGSVGAILAEHVWEHLSLDEGRKAAANCLRYLQTGGYVRIAVPDGYHPDSNYIAAVRPGGSGSGADDHRVLYDYRTLSDLLQQAGFSVKLLEWHDESGNFHFIDWDPEQGLIRRSSRFDPRNCDGSLSYTSLVVDATKA